MLDYAFEFYNNYTVIFYVLIIFAVILEGPVTILTISLLAPKFGFSFGCIYIFSIFGEFFGDLLHYVIGRIFKKNIFKNKSFALFERIEKKLEKHSLFDKLVVIKYTPPITSIGLLYIGFQKININKFIKNTIVFAIINGLIITFIGYNFGKYFINTNDFKYLIIGILFTFLIVYIIIKFISSYLIKYILNGK